MSSSEQGPLDPGRGPDDSPRKPITLPHVPKEDARLHVMIDFKEGIDNALARIGLLDVAGGKAPPECATILDYPLQSCCCPRMHKLLT